MENALLPQLWCLVLSVIHRNLASEEWRLWKESNIGASRWGRRGSGYEELCEWREGLLIESIVGQEASETSGGQEWHGPENEFWMYWNLFRFWMMCNRERCCSSRFWMWWRHGSKFQQQRRYNLLGDYFNFFDDGPNLMVRLCLYQTMTLTLRLIVSYATSSKMLPLFSCIYIFYTTGNFLSVVSAPVRPS